MLVVLGGVRGHRGLAGLGGTRDGQVLIGAVEQLVDGRGLTLAPGLPAGLVGGDLLLQGLLGLGGRGRRLVLAPRVDGAGGDEPGQLLVGVAAVRALGPGPRPRQLPFLPHLVQLLLLLVGQPVLARGGGFFLPLLDVPWGS